MPIVDDVCIDYQLKEQGLSHENADKTRDREPQRLLQQYATQNAAILQRNEERRKQGERGVEQDET
eukprot:6383117-Amphidinium_carterae.1